MSLANSSSPLLECSSTQGSIEFLYFSTLLFKLESLGRTWSYWKIDPLNEGNFERRRKLMAQSSLRNQTNRTEEKGLGGFAAGSFCVFEMVGKAFVPNCRPCLDGLTFNLGIYRRCKGTPTD